MVDEVVDQSLFSSQQAVLQPPPLTGQKDPKRWRMPLVVGGILILFLGLTLTAALLRQQTSDPLASPTPLPSTTVTESLKQQELKRVKTVVEAANPEKLLIVPPMVDMEVAF